MRDAQSPYEVLLAWTRTGQVIDRFSQTDWSFKESVSWSDLGSAAVTVPLLGKAGRVNRPMLKAARRAMSSMSVCICRDRRALWAGPVSTFNWDHNDISLGCSSIGKLFDSRALVAQGYLTDLQATAASLHFELGSRDLVIELLRQGMLGARRDLPVTLPDPSGVAGAALDIAATDLATVFDQVKKVTERDDGPDVLIRPDLYADGDYLRWFVDVGAPALGTGATYRTGDPVPTWDWPVSVLELSGDCDASEMVSTAYVVGNSGGTFRLIGVAQVDRGDPFLALERADRTSVSEDRQDSLDALARSYAGVHAFPTEEWTVAVTPQHEPRYSSGWALGDIVNIATDGSHPWFGAGDHLRRAVGLTHTAKKVTLSTTDGSEVGLPRWTG